MICTGMYGNDAGIGMALTKAVCKMIPGERLLASIAFFAVAVGPGTVGTFVLRFGATAIPAAWVTILASGWCVPEFLRLRRVKKRNAVVRHSGWEARSASPSPESAIIALIIRVLKRQVQLRRSNTMNHRLGKCLWQLICLIVRIAVRHYSELIAYFPVNYLCRL